jgi:predicted sugar kinase
LRAKLVKASTVHLNHSPLALTLSYAEQLTHSGLPSERVLLCLKQLCHALNVPDKLHLELSSVIPEHVGLGSGTQMAIAVGMALSAFYDLGLSDFLAGKYTTLCTCKMLTYRGLQLGYNITK